MFAVSHLVYKLNPNYFYQFPQKLVFTLCHESSRFCLRVFKTDFTTANLIFPVSIIRIIFITFVVMSFVFDYDNDI